MSRYSNVLELLRKVYKVNSFSLGLHTTNSEASKSILRNGLEERSGRTIEGTVKFFGDAKNDVELGDLDWFFPYTDTTVMVGIPSIFEIERDLDSDSGNKHTSDFSVFISMANFGQMGTVAKSIFSSGGKQKIPSELIIGYYDKAGNICLNEKCELLKEDSQFIKQIQKIWEDERNQSFLDFYKSMAKDQINYGKPKTNGE